MPEPDTESWSHFHKNNIRYNSCNKAAWCTYCTEAHVKAVHANQLRSYSDAMAEGRTPPEVKTEDQIKDAWYTKDNAICGKIDTMLAHLAGVKKPNSRSCLHVPSSVRAWAMKRREKTAKAAKAKDTPSSPIAERPTKIQRTESDASGEGNTSPTAVTPGPFHAETVPVPRGPRILSPEERDKFLADLCRLFIIANIAWWVVDIPFVRYFFFQWTGLVLPGRKELSGRVLDQEVEKVQEKVQMNVHHRFGTGQCDGWKNRSKDSIIATVVNVEHTPYLINTHKVTSERKDATNLLKIVEEEIRFFVNVLRIIVVAWCTDASGESAKMRRMLRDKMPWIFVIDCWAHQMNLVVGDIFKTIGTSFASVVDDALDIVKWFNNRTLALGLLKDIQFTQLKKVLCLILPVITRWTTHYQAVRRLLELQTPLRTLLLLEKEKLIASVGKQGEAQARDIVEKLERPGFWEDLSEVKRHLEPLAAATNILQSDRARLDTVLIILANLFHIFSDDSLSLEICRSVLRSLEKRWAKQDQDIIILATVLNPFIRVNAFSPSSIYRKPAKIIELASAAYRRFFGKDPNFEFKKSVTDYLNRHDRWSDQDMGLADFRKADKDMATADLVEIWRRLLPVPDACSPTDPPPPPPDGADGLAYLGAYLMSITPNTASTEREFSKFGIIHTPLRNRLSHDTVRKMTMVNHDTAQKYPMPSRGESKRKHGEEEPSRSEPQSTQGQQTDDSSAHDSVDPLSQTFNDVALNLMVEADDAPGVSDEVLDSMEAPEDLPSNTTPSQPSLSIRITIPPELSEKRAKMLRNLFSFPSRTSSFSAKASFTVLDAFWEVANDDLTREQVLHETVCGASSSSTATTIEPEPLD